MKRISLALTVVASLGIWLPGSASTATAGTPAAAGPKAPVAAHNYGAGAVTVTADGWIHYHSNLEQLGVESKTQSVRGSRGHDGDCTSSNKATGSATDASTQVYEEVAFNPATCDSVYRVATVSATELRAFDAAPAGITGTPESTTSSETNLAATTASSASTGAVAAAVPTWQRWARGKWNDPFGINISTTTAGLRWNQNQWLARDDARSSWQGGGYDVTYLVSSADYWGAYSNRWEWSATSHFQNATFALYVVGVFGASGWAACNFPTTNKADFYHDDQVIGRKDGTWVADTGNDTKSGACTNLVHHVFETGSGWPF